MNRDELKELARLVADEVGSRRVGWLDLAGAATYLSMSQESIRGLVKRRQIAFVRTPTNRIRFRPSDLDDWMVSRMHEYRTREHEGE